MPESGETISTPPSEPQNISSAESHTEEQTLLPDWLEKKLAEEIDNRINAKHQDLQIKYTEVLGVFVALFTFISISIQIFHSVQFLDIAVALIIFIFIALLGFIFMAHIVISGKSFSYIAIGALAIILTLLVFIAKILIPEVRLSNSLPTPSPSSVDGKM